MRYKILLVFSLSAIFCPIYSIAVDLFYTEDGKTVKTLHGYPINSDFTIAEQGDESWLIQVGQKMGPNGYIGKENKLTFGTLGKSKSVYNIPSDGYLGIGKDYTFDRSINIHDIAFIIPDSFQAAPLFVQLRSGETGTLFIAELPSESPGARVVAGNIVKDITIIKLKYDVPKNQRGPSVLPKQFGIKALAVGFTELGIRQAIKILHP